ncbi:MAG: hypothetical protein KTR32_10415 [Granulosicoccus sp.]|nr:hypothetical protein [Granulosicoccus sp.]
MDETDQLAAMTPGATQIDGLDLKVLEARLNEGIAYLLYPGKSWVPERTGVVDVAIIGGGMCGMQSWTAFCTSSIADS